jgi:hypothetical protein
MLFFLMMLLMKLSNVPDWVLPSLGLLLLLLCRLAMFFRSSCSYGSSGDPTPQIKDGCIVEFR